MWDWAMATPPAVPCVYSVPVGGVGVGWAVGSRDGVRCVGPELAGRYDDKGCGSLALGFVMGGEAAVVGKGAVAMGPGLGVLVVVALGSALLGAVEDVVVVSGGADGSVGDMLVCELSCWVRC
jgi:hypothetical protein